MDDYMEEEIVVLHGIGIVIVMDETTTTVFEDINFIVHALDEG